jgi:hypothetical protein
MRDKIDGQVCDTITSTHVFPDSTKLYVLDSDTIL